MSRLDSATCREKYALLGWVMSTSRPSTSSASASSSWAMGSRLHLHMIVHLIDGTYELFRHFYGARRGSKGVDAPRGAVAGVLHTVLRMLETDATHLGVATDHVIESFRNDLWP